MFKKKSVLCWLQQQRGAVKLKPGVKHLTVLQEERRFHSPGILEIFHHRRILLLGPAGNCRTVGWWQHASICSRMRHRRGLAQDELLSANWRGEQRLECPLLALAGDTVRGEGCKLRWIVGHRSRTKRSV